MKKQRWLSLYVENNVGVLAKISGLFSGKQYNLESLTVGTTEDPTISRMTIGLVGTDEVFEQIKKQLNRSVEVIKVVDLTGMDTYMQEVMFIKVTDCSEQEKKEVFRMAQVFDMKLIDYDLKNILLQSMQPAEENDKIISHMKSFKHIEVVRGGNVAIDKL